MILELDCGNSYIKWRLVPPIAALAPIDGRAVDIGQLLDQVDTSAKCGLEKCRLVSVRSDSETDAIALRVSSELGVEVLRAMPATTLGGVTNGYLEPERLGLDRWLAMVAAFSLRRRACLVFDLGTAITVDLIAIDGRHLGGFITPGIPLMRDQLFGHTRRIRYEGPAESVLSDVSPGRSTAQAVEAGCLLMVRSYIGAQLDEASARLGNAFDVYATGGDAALVSDLPGVTCIPDLVFRGLAIACP
ncbi:type III pantothenate kinase [Stutzerimonas azotifigens]|uniref:Type III pantothenate kinase n=1 Tax=Stutzerimonas azotifigens TaxID=291995 RepID=A0ABR5Z605_9GAMM|nr:type III pantothenate kinase [Stutzerimonas azotifigens]MBA1275646.1 type III pantothenate kinase [Stutzerimonas azotifigens]